MLEKRWQSNQENSIFFLNIPRNVQRIRNQTNFFKIKKTGNLVDRHNIIIQMYIFFLLKSGETQQPLKARTFVLLKQDLFRQVTCLVLMAFRIVIVMKPPGIRTRHYNFSIRIFIHYTASVINSTGCLKCNALYYVYLASHDPLT